MMWWVFKTTWHTYAPIPRNIIDDSHGNAGGRVGVYRNGTMQCKYRTGWCRGPGPGVYGGIRTDPYYSTPRLTLHLELGYF